MNRSPTSIVRIAIGICLTSILLMAVMPVSHATYWNGGMWLASFSVKPYSYNNQWQPGMDAALASWNATSTKATITKSTSGKGTIYASSYPDSWFGMYAYSGPRDASRTFTIKLNSRTIVAQQKSYPGSGHKNWVTAVFVHELGHALSLADNPSTTSASIMKYRNDYTNWVNPQGYDINDVRSTYP